MPALLSLLGPLLPYIAGFIAIIVGYFTIRQRGVVAERQKQEKAQAKVQAEVQKAVSKDAAIDQKVEKQLEEIHKNMAAQPVDRDVFKF